MSPRALIACWATTCVFLLAATVAQAEIIGAPAQVAAITQAFRARHQVKPFTARWTETATYMPGSLGGNAGRFRVVKESIFASQKQVTVQVEYRLLFDRKKYRWTVEGDQWDTAAETFSPQTVTTVCDGRIGKSLWVGQHSACFDAGSEIGRLDVPSTQAFIYELKTVGEIKEFGQYSAGIMGPLPQLYVTLEPGVGELATSDWRISTMPAMMDGRECLVLESGDRSIWLDPTRDFIVVRYENNARGKLVYREDSTYAQDDRQRWLPTGWKAFRLHEGRTLWSSESRIIELKFDVATKPGDFSLEFPAGARVGDYVGPIQDYIVKADRTIRPILDEESGRPYELLLTTSPGEAIGPASKPRFVPWVWAAILCLVLCVILVFRHRRLRFSGVG